jgi:hypothetical protein
MPHQHQLVKLIDNMFSAFQFFYFLVFVMAYLPTLIEFYLRFKIVSSFIIDINFFFIFSRIILIIYQKFIHNYY